MSNEVTVEIIITERVKYGRRVTMTREQFEVLERELQASRGGERRRVEERIGALCDRAND